MDTSLLLFLAVLLGLLTCYAMRDAFSQSSEKQNGRHTSRHRVYWSPTSRLELKRNKYVTYNF